MQLQQSFPAQFQGTTSTFGEQPQFQGQYGDATFAAPQPQFHGDVTFHAPQPQLQGQYGAFQPQFQGQYRAFQPQFQVFDGATFGARVPQYSVGDLQPPQPNVQPLPPQPNDQPPQPSLSGTRNATSQTGSVSHPALVISPVHPVSPLPVLPHPAKPQSQLAVVGGTGAAKTGGDDIIRRFGSKPPPGLAKIRALADTRGLVTE
jgi:hypothetical protein